MDKYQFEITFECLEQLSSGTPPTQYTRGKQQHSLTKLGIQILNLSSLTSDLQHRQYLWPPCPVIFCWRIDLQVRAWPGTGLTVGWAYSCGCQQVCLWGRSSKSEPNTFLGNPRCDRITVNRFIRWPRVRACGVLHQQWIWLGRIEQGTAKQARCRADRKKRSGRKASCDTVCHKMVSRPWALQHPSIFTL